MVEHPYVGQLVRLINFRNDEQIRPTLRTAMTNLAEMHKLFNKVLVVRALYSRSKNDNYPDWIILLKEGPPEYSWPRTWFMPVHTLAHLVGQYRG